MLDPGSLHCLLAEDGRFQSQCFQNVLVMILSHDASIQNMVHELYNFHISFPPAGAVAHGKDYRRSAGGFIHGFRPLALEEGMTTGRDHNLDLKFKL